MPDYVVGTRVSGTIYSDWRRIEYDDADDLNDLYADSAVFESDGRNVSPRNAFVRFMASNTPLGQERAARIDIRDRRLCGNLYSQTGLTWCGRYRVRGMSATCPTCDLLSYGCSDTEEIEYDVRRRNKVNATNKEFSPFGYACGRCGVLGHNKATCESAERCVSKVGIEIEGAWSNLSAVQTAARSAGLGMSADGSLQGFFGASPYEFKTRPGNVREALSQLCTFYPDFTNNTCGMHVHTSFKDPTHITRLYCPEFFEYFRSMWQLWGTERGLHENSEFFRRLRGDNDYCQINQESEGDLRTVSGCTRYSHLNFSAWDRHGTVECRMLPMFENLQDGIDAVQYLIRIYESFLAQDQEIPVSEEIRSDVGEGADTAVLRFVETAQRDESVMELQVSDPGPVPEGMVRMPIISVERYVCALRQ